MPVRGNAPGPSPAGVQIPYPRAQCHGDGPGSLPSRRSEPYLLTMMRVAIPYGMVTITEDDAAAIRDAFHKGGEVPAAAELRRRFPEIADTVEARRAAQIIAERATLPDLPPTVVRLRPRKRT